MRQEVRPLFLECDRGQAATAWAGVGANALLIIWCLLWLKQHFSAVTPSACTLLAHLLFALFIADLFSGLVHWFSDTWFDEAVWKRTVSIAREHHLYPEHILGYGFRDYAAYSSWPTVVVIGPVVLLLTLGLEPAPIVVHVVIICVIVAAVMFLGSYAHALGHKKADAWLLRRLQAAHILISPRHHGVHHRGNHDVRYCVINGWANYLCDPIGFWRGLERLVVWATGAVPRSNDREWFSRFQNNPMYPPVKVRGRE